MKPAAQPQPTPASDAPASTTAPRPRSSNLRVKKPFLPRRVLRMHRKLLRELARGAKAAQSRPGDTGSAATTRTSSPPPSTPPEGSARPARSVSEPSSPGTSRIRSEIPVAPTRSMNRSASPTTDTRPRSGLSASLRLEPETSANSPKKVRPSTSGRSSSGLFSHEGSNAGVQALRASLHREGVRAGRGEADHRLSRPLREVRWTRPLGVLDWISTPRREIRGDQLLRVFVHEREVRVPDRPIVA